MIYDCFTFFNEIELLKVRLYELDPVVDYFVLVECDKTWSNQPKPFYFECAKPQFEKYLHKILHVKVTDLPTGPDPRTRELFARDAIKRGIPTIQDDDVFIVSDLDEIMRRSVVPTIQFYLYGITGWHMRSYRFHINMLEVGIDNGRAVLGRVLKQIPAHLIRNLIPDIFIEGAGWHFTYLGKPEEVLYKINSFCHHCDDVMVPLRQQILAGQPMSFNTQRPFPIDDSYPELIKENLDYYRQLGWIKE